MGFYNPTEFGGSMLTIAPNTGGLGEPLNVIVSGHSDATVLVDSEDNVNETSELRWDYGDPSLGTCTETIKGGNHFRYWIQDGSKANSGAIFMATSYELPLQMGHDIIFDGYNLGRDWLIGNATAQTSLIPTGNITNGTTYSGQTSFGGWTYKTDVIYLSGILSNSSQGVNHNVSVGNTNTLPVDGYVAVMTISIVSQPQQATSGALSIPRSFSWAVVVALLAAFAVSLSA
ncbi:hypothetical protein BN946_scf184992.g3 [Trametes cinnabarina]|uniref:Uncharacterized protein n=1 Tax=Pycnoporus cinnabarinus TaxID=5643 RepID=A0A060S9U3_PYCCI|nr:hypothetical protein BN946_scf184992.g3 [Trametes cinnabarina]